MSRTALPFVLAALLLALALGLALGPKGSVAPVPPPPVTPTVVVAPPTPPPPSIQVATGGSLSVTATPSDPLLTLGTGRSEFLRLDLVGVKVEGAQRARVNLAVVLDRSGSMAGDKIAAARKASHALVDRLDEGDRLAFVTFGSDVTVLFPSTIADRNQRQAMHEAIDRIVDTGGTNLSGGIEAGLAQIRGHVEAYPVNRLLVISDGQANEGLTGRQALAGLARRTQAQGVSISTIGVGLDFDEDTLEAMSDSGGGQYHYLSEASQLEALLNGELQQLGAAVAGNVTVELTLPPHVRLTEWFGFQPERLGDGRYQVRLADVAAGEHRKLMVRLSVDVGAESALALATAQVHYADLRNGRALTEARAEAQVSGTRDDRLAEQKRDAQTYGQVARVQVTQAARRAASLFSRGDVAAAKEELAKGKLEAQGSGAFANESNLDAELDRLAPASALAPSPTSEAGRNATKALKQQAYDYAR